MVAEKRDSDGAAFVSPAKWYKRYRKRIVVHGIGHAVHESLLALFKQRGLFDVELVTLWKVLRKFGFKYKQVNDKR